jgi:hypothetical protein
MARRLKLQYLPPGSRGAGGGGLMNRDDEVSGGVDEGRAAFARMETAAPPAEASAGATVSLSVDELRALCWALDNYLPGLRYDEARVKLGRDRHEVVARETLLSALRQRFGDALGGNEGAPVR